MGKMKEKQIHLQRLREFCKQEKIQSLKIYYENNSEPYKYTNISDNEYEYSLLGCLPTKYLE